VTLGRKNYLFMGSKGGGDAAAVAYTLIETCRMNKVDAGFANSRTRVSVNPGQGFR